MHFKNNKSMPTKRLITEAEFYALQQANPWLGYPNIVKQAASGEAWYQVEEDAEGNPIRLFEYYRATF